VLNLQPKYSFEAEATKINSRPDFSIEKGANQICCLFLDETKHLNNIKLDNQFGECHLAGDLIAAGYSNYAQPFNPKFQRDQIIFAVRVIGTRFTFYRCSIKMSYLTELEKATISPLESLIIQKYPSSDYGDLVSEFGYDFSNGLHRLLIIELLIQLREQIRNA
jgi:hypothetical protein